MVVDGIICSSATYEQARNRTALAGQLVDARADALNHARSALDLALSRFAKAVGRYHAANAHLRVCIVEEAALAKLSEGARESSR